MPPQDLLRTKDLLMTKGSFEVQISCLPCSLVTTCCNILYEYSYGESLSF